MDWMLSLIILLSVILLPFKKQQRRSLVALLVILTFLMLQYPAVSIQAAQNSIELFLFTVLPALFPFFLVSDMLTALKVPENLSRLFQPMMKLMFRTSGHGAYIFLMSIFSGYPTGVKITAELVKKRVLSVSDGQRILCFASTSGPLFIIGVAGTALLGSPNIGYLLFGIHIAGALLNGLLWSLLLPGKPAQAGFSSVSAKSPGDLLMKRTKLHSDISSTGASVPPPAALAADAILHSFEACSMIGGFVLLFGVMLPLLDCIDFFTKFSLILHQLLFLPVPLSTMIATLFKASLELTNGTALLSQLSSPMEIRLVLLSFLIAFSGFSILGQASSLIIRTDLNQSIYFLSKLTHGLLSALLCQGLIHTNLVNGSSTVMSGNLHNNLSRAVMQIGGSPIVCMETMLVLLLFLILLYKLLSTIKYKTFYHKLMKRR